MHYMKGDLYSDSELRKYDYIGFTANSVLTKDGRLVMGAGSAKAVRDKFKGIDKRLGDVISGCKHPETYLIVKDTDTNIFALQTKIHWKDKSPVGLVKYSLRYLKRLAESRPNRTFAVPYPAISNGGLTKDVLVKYIEELPDNVYIYEL